NALEGKLDKHETINLLSNSIGNIGGSITDAITLGIPKAIGEIILVGSNFFKLKLDAKSGEEFYLTFGNEKKELDHLNNSFVTLTKFLQSHSELSATANAILKIENKTLFTNKYKIYEIIITDG